MERKYAKLMKGLEMCAGPECCKDGCPYYGATTGGMTCRARLLLDANIAITNEQTRAEEAEAQLQDVTETLDAERLANSDLEGKFNDLDAAARTIREERDILRERCQVQRNEINALLLRVGKAEGKTDRPSVISDDLAKQIGELVAHANYQQGRADTLAKIVERCSFGGGCRHE